MKYHNILYATADSRRRSYMTKTGLLPKLPKKRDLTSNRRQLGKTLTSFFKFLFIRAARWIMLRRNKSFLHDEIKVLERAVFDRDDCLGVLTFSNHISVFDDPGIWIGSLPFRSLTLDNMRSVFVSEEWFYALGSFSAAVLRGLNCLPLRRGDPRGLNSPQLQKMHERLNPDIGKREWVHMFAEGRILQPWRFDSVGLPRIGKLRLGTAKLILTTPPSRLIVIPIYHSGLDLVFPEDIPDEPFENDGRPTRRSGKTRSFFPRKNQRIDIYVGEPIDFSDLVPPHGHPFHSDRTDRDLLAPINDRLKNSMLTLEKKAAEDRSKLSLRY